MFDDDDPPGRARLCNYCHDSLKAKKLPSYAIANGLLIGEIPDCLKCLNSMEKVC